MRRLRLALMVGGAIGLIPWIVFLVITLPANYVALGFDVLLVAFMVTTAVLVFLRRQLVLLTAFTTGVLLICDAWFDVMTAGPHDLWASALTATLVELPVAIMLIAIALRMSRLNRGAVVAARSRDAALAATSAAVDHAYA
jgi:ABC-type dipeptide/oligopeptide/nickel transport system permease subunit